MADRRRTLCFLVTEDWYFVSHRLALAQAAIARGWRVVVATRVGTHGETITRAGCELRPLGWRRSRNTPWDHARALGEIVRLLRDDPPDLLHLVALKPVVFGAFAARLARRPARVNALAGLGYAFSSGALRARVLRAFLGPLLRVALAGEDQVTIVQNRADRDVIVGNRLVDPAHVRLIRGAGVDPAEFAGPRTPTDPPIVVMISRMLWDKGVGRFVDAARALRARGSPARFVLVGAPDPDNPGSVPLAQLEEWRAHGPVEWWGHRPDIAAVLAGASVFCLPTEYGEGIPRSLLEAAAAGLAIIATDQAGCREVVADGESGLLIPPGDPAGLCGALERVIDDAALRARLGASARIRIADGFTLPQVIGETLDVYESLRRPAR